MAACPVLLQSPGLIQPLPTEAPRLRAVVRGELGTARGVSGTWCSSEEEDADEGTWCSQTPPPLGEEHFVCKCIAVQLPQEVPCYLSACSHDRIRELAEPKKAACANDLRLVWGNQETIWTMSRRAMTARPSARILELAKPKQDFGKNLYRPLYLYSCGRESTIWEHPSLVDFRFPSDRLVKLAEPKQYQAAYLLQRPRTSPEWPVSPAALSCKASPRIVELAQPKVLHPEFLPAKKVPTQVTNAAALARASSRIQQLAEPCVKKVTCCYEYSPFESAIRPVSKFAQKAIASPRTLELAMAKRLHPDYMPMRDAAWSVTKAAKQAVATPRLVELAQPCKRLPMNLTQFNPNAFTVKESAKKAICSARIKELACPIKR